MAPESSGAVALNLPVVAPRVQRLTILAKLERYVGQHRKTQTKTGASRLTNGRKSLRRLDSGGRAFDCLAM